MTFQTFRRAFSAAVLATALSGAAGCDNLADIIKDSLDEKGATGGKGAEPATICREEKRADGSYCKSCYDAAGVVVGGDCSTPLPPARECKQTTLEDGTLCNICTDATGVTTRDCRPAPARCGAEIVADGECKVCYDASGKEVSRSCASGPIRCRQEKLPDGTLCDVCADSAGNVTRKCPATPPPPVAVECKEERPTPELSCKVCYDANGVGISRECIPLI